MRSAQSAEEEKIINLRNQIKQKKENLIALIKGSEANCKLYDEFKSNLQCNGFKYTEFNEIKLPSINQVSFNTCREFLSEAKLSIDKFLIIEKEIEDGQKFKECSNSIAVLKKLVDACEELVPQPKLKIQSPKTSTTEFIENKLIKLSELNEEINKALKDHAVLLNELEEYIVKLNKLVDVHEELKKNVDGYFTLISEAQAEQPKKDVISSNSQERNLTNFETKYNNLSELLGDLNDAQYPNEVDVNCALQATPSFLKNYTEVFITYFNLIDAEHIDNLLDIYARHIELLTEKFMGGNEENKLNLQLANVEKLLSKKGVTTETKLKLFFSFMHEAYILEEIKHLPFLSKQFQLLLKLDSSEVTDQQKFVINKNINLLHLIYISINLNSIYKFELRYWEEFSAIKTYSLQSMLDYIYKTYFLKPLMSGEWEHVVNACDVIADAFHYLDVVNIETYKNLLENFKEKIAFCKQEAEEKISEEDYFQTLNRMSNVMSSITMDSKSLNADEIYSEIKSIEKCLNHQFPSIEARETIPPYNKNYYLTLKIDMYCLLLNKYIVLANLNNFNLSAKVHYYNNKLSHLTNEYVISRSEFDHETLSKMQNIGFVFYDTAKYLLLSPLFQKTDVDVMMNKVIDSINLLSHPMMPTDNQKINAALIGCVAHYILFMHMRDVKSLNINLTFYNNFVLKYIDTDEVRTDEENIKYFIELVNYSVLDSKSNNIVREKITALLKQHPLAEKLLSRLPYQNEEEVINKKIEKLTANIQSLEKQYDKLIDEDAIKFIEFTNEGKPIAEEFNQKVYLQFPTEIWTDGFGEIELIPQNLTDNFQGLLKIYVNFVKKKDEMVDLNRQIISRSSEIQLKTLNKYNTLDVATIIVAPNSLEKLSQLQQTQLEYNLDLKKCAELSKMYNQAKIKRNEAKDAAVRYIKRLESYDEEKKKFLDKKHAELDALTKVIPSKPNAKQNTKKNVVRKTQNETKQEAQAAAILQRKAEAEAKLKAAEEKKIKEEQEEAQRKIDAEKKRKEEAILKIEKEAKLKVEREAKRKAQEEAKRKAQEEAKRKAAEEAKRKAAEEKKIKEQEEAKRKAAEEKKIKEQEEAKRKAAEEKKIKEQQEKEKIEEEIKQKALEEEKQKIEEEAKQKALEENQQETNEKIEFVEVPFNADGVILPNENTTPIRLIDFDYLYDLNNIAKEAGSTMLLKGSFILYLLLLAYGMDKELALKIISNDLDILFKFNKDFDHKKFIRDQELQVVDNQLICFDYVNATMKREGLTEIDFTIETSPNQKYNPVAPIQLTFVKFVTDEELQMQHASIQLGDFNLESDKIYKVGKYNLMLYMPPQFRDTIINTCEGKELKLFLHEEKHDYYPYIAAKLFTNLTSALPNLANNDLKYNSFARGLISYSNAMANLHKFYSHPRNNKRYDDLIKIYKHFSKIQNTKYMEKIVYLFYYGSLMQKQIPADLIHVCANKCMFDFFKFLHGSLSKDKKSNKELIKIINDIADIRVKALVHEIEMQQQQMQQQQFRQHQIQQQQFQQQQMQYMHMQPIQAQQLQPIQNVSGKEVNVYNVNQFFVLPANNVQSTASPRPPSRGRGNAMQTGTQRVVHVNDVLELLPDDNKATDNVNRNIRGRRGRGR